MSKMKTGVLAALLTSTTALTASADIDRAGHNISVLFEEGNYAELSFGLISPDVKGTFNHPIGGPMPLSQSATDYTVKTFAYKHQFSDALSVALISDEPYGATIQYVDPPIAPGMAEVNSHALTAVARYNFGNGFSVHGGIRGEKLEGQIISTPGLLTAEGDYEIGGLIGASYERPEIALRVSLTYYSSIDHELDGAHNLVPTTATVTTPERLHLDFQTGIAENTLLFGSIHYAAWGGISLDSGGGATNWVNFPDDTTDFTLGVGRRLSDALSASITLGYEEGAPTGTTFLAPAGTRKSIGLGVSYQVTENVKISGGVRYIEFSDKVVQGLTTFTGGNAIAAGAKVGISF